VVVCIELSYMNSDKGTHKAYIAPTHQTSSGLQEMERLARINREAKRVRTDLGPKAVTEVIKDSDQSPMYFK